MSDDKIGKAIEHDILLEQLMDSRIPKNDHEHCAVREITRLNFELAAVTQELEQVKFEYAECELRTSEIIDDQQAELEHAKDQLADVIANNEEKAAFIDKTINQLQAKEYEIEQLKQSSVVMPEVMPQCIYSRVFRSLKAHGFVVGDCEIRDIYQAIRQALATNDKEKDSE